MTSAGKYTGAAVLARTSFHNGIFRLQSVRSGSLYFASGLLLTGHAESVVTFFVTTNRMHFKSSGSRVVVGPNTFFNCWINGSAVCRYLYRSSNAEGSNISLP